mgnify:CR=1 FL=1
MYFKNVYCQFYHLQMHVQFIKVLDYYILYHIFTHMISLDLLLSGWAFACHLKIKYYTHHT